MFCLRKITITCVSGSIKATSLYRKLKVPDQIINEDKEALKKAQAIDGNLANIRSRVKSGKVTVSRGLNRGQT